MSSKLFELGHELDRESCDYLQANYPALFDTLEVAVIRGATPEEIRAFVLRRVGIDRQALATRCEAAARFLVGQVAA